MILYIYDISYFSGKMQAYLRYQQIPHETRHASWMQLAHELVEEAGVMEVPMIRLADGRLMRDTTSMIEHFEAHGSTAPVLPEDPALAWLMQLMEDYADEGLWRPALYFRWAYPKDAELYARRFHEDFLDLPLLHLPVVGRPIRAIQRRHMIWRQRRHYMAGEGVTRANREAVEQHYRDELADLETLLAERDFLLGDRPCLVDFGYFASMFRHFSIDPTPGRIMREQAPRTYAWVARLWAARADQLAAQPLRSFDALAAEPAVRGILGRIARIYLPYLLANAQAVHARRARFDVEIDGHAWPDLPAVPFRAWGRKRLVRSYAALPEDARARLAPLLRDTGCEALLLADTELDPRHPPGELLPFCGPRRELSTLAKWRLTFTGTPHHEAT